MSILAFSLVLLAALTHAAWNSWLKIAGDRHAALTALGLGWAIVGILAAFRLGVPEPSVWVYLAASTLVHTIYIVVLTKSYQHGDLSMAYPIARGIGPMIVVAVSSLILGDALGAAGLAGALLIVAGAVWLGLPSSTPGRKGVVLAILTGMLIGAYTIIDGLGGRAGSSPHRFAAWLFVLSSAPVIGIGCWVHRGKFVANLGPALPRGVVAGALSAGAYWIVIWAMSEANMGLVAALRESSVVFAALIGGLMLNERVRWAGVVLVFAGIVLTKTA